MKVNVFYIGHRFNNDRLVVRWRDEYKTSWILKKETMKGRCAYFYSDLLYEMVKDLMFETNPNKPK